MIKCSPVALLFFLVLIFVFITCYINLRNGYIFLWDVRKDWSIQTTEISRNCTLVFCNKMTDSITVTGNNLVAEQESLFSFKILSIQGWGLFLFANQRINKENGLWYGTAWQQKYRKSKFLWDRGAWGGGGKGGKGRDGTGWDCPNKLRQKVSIFF